MAENEEILKPSFSRRFESYDKACQTEPLEELFSKSFSLNNKNWKDRTVNFGKFNENGNFYSTEERIGDEWRGTNRNNLHQERYRGGSTAEALTPYVTFFNNDWRDSPKSITDIQCHPFEDNLIVASYCEPELLSENRMDQISSANSLLNRNSLRFNNRPLSPSQNSNQNAGETSSSGGKSSPEGSTQVPESHQKSRKNVAAIVWSIEGKPVSNLCSKHQVTSINWDPSNVNNIIGGTQVGQILYWDTRVGDQPVQSSKLISSKWQGHMDMVNNLSIIGKGGETGDFVSTCKAGRLCTWTRNMLDKPLMKLELRQPGSLEDSINLVTQWNVVPTSLSFPYGDNTFFLGSQSGQLFQGTLEGTTEGDPPGLFRQIGPQFEQRRTRRFSIDGFTRTSRHLINRHPAGAEAHRRLISGLHCHPGVSKMDQLPDFSDLMLTSSWDWTCNLWSSRDPSRPLWSVEYVDKCYDVRWSPKHPFLFSVLSSKNKVQLWHLGKSLSEPLIELPLTWSLDSETSSNLKESTPKDYIPKESIPKYPIPKGSFPKGSIPKGGKLRWTQGGKQLLCGDLRGNIHVLDIMREESMESLENLSSEEIETMCEKLEDLRTRGR